jgi:NitT/TauT family transport system ATP-binding protein
LLDLRIDAKAYVSADGARTEVVRGFALKLSAGEFGALIGPSGCGKTTILRIAAGLDKDFVGDRRALGVRRLGIVFQEPRLLPWRTVAENIRLVLPPGEATADLGPLIATLGLGAHMSRYPGELSLGLARRAAIARAFAVRPDFLLLDEPFVSLDPAVAARLRSELAALTQREKVTTLLVTHNLDEAVQLADSLFFLSNPPARVIAEIRPQPPRGARSEEAIARIVEEVRGSPLLGAPRR